MAYCFWQITVMGHLPHIAVSKDLLPARRENAISAYEPLALPLPAVAAPTELSLEPLPFLRPRYEGWILSARENLLVVGPQARRLPAGRP